MKLKKTNVYLGVALATLTMAGALVSPQAAALTKAERTAEAANNKAEILETQLRAMQDEIAALRAQVNAPAATADTQKVQELDAWMTSVKSEPVKAKSKDNMAFFRGGYNRNDHARGTIDATSPYFDVLASSNPNPNINSNNSNGWYMGAGVDFSVDDNLWGMMDNTEAMIEVMFDYKQFNGKSFNYLTLNYVTANQFTLAASPKIKFLKGSAFRPWLIPAGFEVNVISPPSGGVTVLNPGIQFGLGADYKIWKNLYVGADTRYHYSPGNIEGVSTSGLTAGGYLGIGW